MSTAARSTRAFGAAVLVVVFAVTAAACGRVDYVPGSADGSARECPNPDQSPGESADRCPSPAVIDGGQAEEWDSGTSEDGSAGPSPEQDSGAAGDPDSGAGDDPDSGAGDDPDSGAADDPDSGAADDPDSGASGCGGPNSVTDESTGHCYFALVATTTWYEAKQACPREVPGSYLAMITSAAENAAVARLAPAGVTRFWINGSDAATEGVWAWLDGTPFGYTNWNAGEPNSGDGDEDCAMLDLGLGARWADHTCASADVAALCEIFP